MMGRVRQVRGMVGKGGKGGGAGERERREIGAAAAARYIGWGEGGGKKRGWREVERRWG